MWRLVKSHQSTHSSDSRGQHSFAIILKNNSRKEQSVTLNNLRLCAILPQPQRALLWLACLPNAIMASFSAMLHSSAKQNSLFYFRMAGGYTRKSYCSKKAGIPGYMSEFPTRDIFRHETGTLNEYLCSLRMLYAHIAFLISHAYMMVNCPEHFRGGPLGRFNLASTCEPSQLSKYLAKMGMKKLLLPVWISSVSIASV